MNQGKYIFAQLTDFLPHRVLYRIVDKYEGNKRVRSFTCWNQMLCMAFGHLTDRNSIRDLMLSLEAHQSKCYHLRFGPTVSRRCSYRNDFEISVEKILCHSLRCLGFEIQRFRVSAFGTLELLHLA